MAGQQRGEETRERILAAGLEAFARHGYAAASVAEICAGAGVTKGAFYHHFQSKQALFLEMLERWLGGIDGQLRAARGGEGDVARDLQRMTAMIQQVFAQADGGLSILIEFLAEAGHSPTVWQATVVPLRKYRAFFAQMIREGTGQGGLRAVDAELAGNVLMSFAIGLLALGLLDPEGEDWGQVARRGMDILLDGLRCE